MTPLHQTLIHMTSTPLQQTLCNGLLYGLKVQYPLSIEDAEGSSDDLRIKEMYPAMLYHWKVLKPVLFSLDMLDKEIEINGERFVPIERIRKLSTSNIDFSPMSQLWMLNTNRDGEVAINVMSRINELLDQWHFNRRNLPDSDFIPVTNEFNPY